MNGSPVIDFGLIEFNTYLPFSRIMAPRIKRNPPIQEGPSSPCLGQNENGQLWQVYRIYNDLNKALLVTAGQVGEDK